METASRPGNLFQGTVDAVSTYAKTLKSVKDAGKIALD